MEEDIKILEEMITWDCLLPNKRQTEALENLIKGYRELEKFRDITLMKSKTKFANVIKDSIYFEYIPKSKIKEKIEELEEEKLCFYSDYAIEERNNKIQVLHELMEEK